jgi:hypothetical protein
MDMPHIIRVDINPGIEHISTPSVSKFLAMVKFLNIDVPRLANGFFAWHGTQEAAVAPISHTGFDPPAVLDRYMSTLVLQLQF